MQGLGFICDFDGKIIKIIRNDFNLEYLNSDESFISIFNNYSRDKARDFFNSVKYQNSAFNWELNIDINKETVSFSFSGSSFGKRLLIWANRLSDNLKNYYEELANVDEEVKEFNFNINASYQPQSHDKLLFDELSRVNNELINIQRELAKKNAELEILNKQKNQFLGMAAHDLRNPLSVVINLSEFILQETEDILDSEHFGFVKQIHKSGKFMLKLINELLDISAIESGKTELNRQETDIIKLIEENIKYNTYVAKNKNIQIQLKFDENIPMLLIDKSKIEQVMNNLISNAIKFSFPETTIEVIIQKKENEIIISVKDQGQGIAANEISQLFKEFSKIGAYGTGGEKNTGLGLFVIKKIVDAHKGKIGVESESGNGSVFHFSLPMDINRQLTIS